jgi:predicted dehydrogenase
MEKINWGIIGCGDVTEVKSGPAFNKVPQSALMAVMRRDAAKAADYARRHGVPKWYSDARQLINDPEVNAIYIATPPASHEEYALAALQAGKPVYVEKPMAPGYAAAARMATAAATARVKLVVAHYRRAQPLFRKVKQLLADNTIGQPLLASLALYKKPLTPEELQQPKIAWRVDAAVAGGGLFHDLAPHQLDLMYHFFGPVEKAGGMAVNQAGAYAADDMVAGTILFKNGLVFNGAWCFNAPAGEEKDYCEILGTEGKIRFSIFDHQPVTVTANGQTTGFSFDVLPHVQQPMIESVVDYFLDRGPNPCPAAEGVEVMHLIDEFTLKT